MALYQKKALFILAVIIFAVACLMPTVLVAFKKEPPKTFITQPINLGLDLKGGLYFTLEVDTKEAVKSRLAQLSLAIKDELNKEKGGVLRGKQVGEDSLEITLLSDEYYSKLDDYIRRTYRDLREASKTGTDRIVVTYQLDSGAAKEIEKNAAEQAQEVIRNRVDQTGVREPLIQRQGEKRIIVELPDLDVKDMDMVKRTIGSVAKLEFRLVADPTKPSGATRSFKSQEDRQGEDVSRDAVLEDEVLMTGDAIKTASANPDMQRSGYKIDFRLTAFGAKMFDAITARNVGRRLAIVLDNVVQSSPTIQDRISGGQAEITGRFTPDDARRIAIVLRSGALPAPLRFVEERSVGATLGADSIHKGIVAALIGAAVVFVFTLVYYRKSGLIAVASLILNLLFLLAMLAFLGATLTLPGLAGLALTIGMAVDSNIIIYERIREETRLGATARAAIDAGFLKAHWTILDANITTLIAGVILYMFGTGPVKGFAVTLSLGILTTLFCALFVTKVGFEMFKLTNEEGELSI